VRRANKVCAQPASTASTCCATENLRLTVTPRTLIDSTRVIFGKARGGMTLTRLLSGATNTIWTMLDNHVTGMCCFAVAGLNLPSRFSILGSTLQIWLICVWHLTLSKQTNKMYFNFIIQFAIFFKCVLTCMVLFVEILFKLKVSVHCSKGWGRI